MSYSSDKLKKSSPLIKLFSEDEEFIFVIFILLSLKSKSNSISLKKRLLVIPFLKKSKFLTFDLAFKLCRLRSFKLATNFVSIKDFILFSFSLFEDRFNLLRSPLISKSSKT